MSLYLGIDSGTQSVKAVVLDLDTRKVIAEARAPQNPSRPDPLKIQFPTN